MREKTAHIYGGDLLVEEVVEDPIGGDHDAVPRAGVPPGPCLTIPMVRA